MIKISKEEYQQLQRYKDNEKEDIERHQEERRRKDKWEVDNLADIHRRSDAGEVFSLSD